MQLVQGTEHSSPLTCAVLSQHLLSVATVLISITGGEFCLFWNFVSMESHGLSPRQSPILLNQPMIWEVHLCDCVELRHILFLCCIVAHHRFLAESSCQFSH